MKIYIPIVLLIAALNAYAQQDSNEQKIDSLEIDEVIVTGTIPFDDKQVEKFYRTNSVSTIDYVIERLDGMALIRRGSYAMEPTLNGFSGGQLNITIDGMKMFGACTDRMDPITSYIEPSNLKSIAVAQGSEGCHTGCNIGGSVDMSLKEPDIHEGRTFYTSFAPGYETNSKGRTVLFSTGYAKNKWQWALNSAYRKSDSYTEANGNVVPFTQYEKTNIHSVFKFLPNSGQSVKADVLFDLARNVGYASLPMDVGKARAYLLALEYKNQRYANLTAKVYYNSVLHIMDDSKRDSTYYVTNKLTGQKEKVYMRMDMPGTSSTFGAYVKTLHDISSNTRLAVQVDNYTNHSLAEMTMHMQYPGKPREAPMYLQTWPDLIRNVSGLYLQGSWYFSDKMILNLSGRLDYTINMLQNDLAKEQFSVFGYQLSKTYQKLAKGVNLSFQYMVSKPFRIDLDAGYSERTPTIGEQFGFYLYNAHDGYDYIGNPNIKTEKSVFSRIEFLYSQPWLKINLDQSISLVSDYIMGVTSATIPPMNFNTNGVKVYSNLPGATVYSANLQAQIMPAGKLSAFLLTKYIWGQLNSGDPMPLIAPLNNVLALSYQQPGWNITLENESALAQNRINVSFGEIKSMAYTKFNLKGNYHFMFLSPWMLDVSLGISNMLNARYYEHLDWGRIYRPGRSFDLLLRFSF